MKLFKVNGYFKDDRSEFSDYLIAEYDHAPDGYSDDDIFYYGLSEEQIQKSSEDDGLDFVITSYEVVSGGEEGMNGKTIEIDNVIQIKNIDFNRLQKQKEILISMIQDWGGSKDKDQQNAASEVEGIVHLIDAIQDYAVDSLGMKESEVFKSNPIKRTRSVELGLLCCIIRENEIINETLFQSFDKVFEIAEAFIDKYGIDETVWGIDMEYEETVVAFAKDYVSNEENKKSNKH